MNRYGGSPESIRHTVPRKFCAMPYTYGSNDAPPGECQQPAHAQPARRFTSGAALPAFLEQARERSNARMIVIDPRHTDTAAGREDE